jgi:hypothetical protein
MLHTTLEELFQQATETPSETGFEERIPSIWVEFAQSK